jgi:hypothetical protein
MATSGTVTYKLGRNALVLSALRLVGAIDPEALDTSTVQQGDMAIQALNMMMKSWEAKGIQLWEKRYAVIFPQLSQSQYVLGTPDSGGDHACLSTPLGTGFVQTTVTSQVGLTLTVGSTSSSGTVGTPAIAMTTTWNIGIQQTNGSLFWTTINGAPVGNVITLTATSGVNATAGSYVYAYQTKLWRPLRITDGFVRQAASTNDVPITVISRENYNRFGNKTSTGTPIQAMYDPQLTSGYLYLYPAPSTVAQLIYLEVQKPIDDFGTSWASGSSEDYDMPQEWVEALKYNLALRLAPEYRVPRETYDQIKELAAVTYTQIDSWDQEQASVSFGPNLPQYSSGYGK